MAETDNSPHEQNAGTTIIEKGWDWWSNFLQREYYASPSERRGWDAVAGMIARATDLTPGQHVLDLGSGSGEMVYRLAMMGADVTGVEHSGPLVQHCIRVAAERGITATFVAADMFHYTPSQQFDIILSLNTSFGYGTDEQNRQLIANIGNWLRPGGRFYLDVCTANSAEAFGHWRDQVAGGLLMVDNSYDEDTQQMISYPTWIAPDETTVYTCTIPEIVRLYSREDVEGMIRNAGMTHEKLIAAMGRRFKQTDDQMLTTWISTKN